MQNKELPLICNIMGVLVSICVYVHVTVIALDSAHTLHTIMSVFAHD